jgi:hypothetical protein
VGETFTVQLNGESQTFHIKPNIFSHRTMRALAAWLKAKKREARSEVLALLGKEKSLDETSKSVIIKQLIDSAMDPTISYDAAVEALQSADGEGLAIALSLNVDGIPDTKKAMEIIDAYPRIFELIRKVAEAGEEALAASGN